MWECTHYSTTVEPLFNRHFGNSSVLRKRGALYREVNLYTAACSWDLCGVRYREVVRCGECPLMEVPPVEPPLRTLHITDNLYLMDTAYVPTTCECIQIGLYIKDTSLLRTLVLVPLIEVPLI